MGLRTDLNSYLKDAMRSKDKVRLLVIRLLLSSIKNEEIDQKRELGDEEVVSLVQREIKRRKESIGEFEKGGRTDLVEKEKAEMEILYTFLPQQASEDEIRAVIKEIVDAIPEGEKINIGKIMPAALAKLKGKADGKTISGIAREFMN